MASGPGAAGLPTRDDTPPPDFDAIIALPFGPFGIRAHDGEVHELVFLAPGTPLESPRNATAGAAAHDEEDVAGPDIEGQVGDHGDGPVSGVVGLCETLHAQSNGGLVER